MKQVKDARRAMSVNQAAKYTGYSRATVEYWLSDCGLPYEEPPTRGSKNRFRRIRRSDLDEFLDRHYKMQSKRRRGRSIPERRVSLLPREDVDIDTRSDYTNASGGRAASS